MFVQGFARGICFLASITLCAAWSNPQIDMPSWLSGLLSATIGVCAYMGWDQ